MPFSLSASPFSFELRHFHSPFYASFWLCFLSLFIFIFAIAFDYWMPIFSLIFASFSGLRLLSHFFAWFQIASHYFHFHAIAASHYYASAGYAITPLALILYWFRAAITLHYASHWAAITLIRQPYFFRHYFLRRFLIAAIAFFASHSHADYWLHIFIFLLLIFDMFRHYFHTLYSSLLPPLSIAFFRRFHQYWW